MRKLITKDQTIELKHRFRLYPEDISANDIRIEGDREADLIHLNLNIVKYNIDKYDIVVNIIKNCNINKLVLNGNRHFVISNSTINDIYIQSEIESLKFRNTNIPNLHGRVDLINEIEIVQ